MASGTDQSGDILQNELYFPAFRDLGDKNDLHDKYWVEDDQIPDRWVQAITWCFLAEITNDDFSQMSFLRNRILVRDRRGRSNIPVSFYPNRGLFDFKTLKKGRTICVMLAEKHKFLDMTVGLCIEGLDTVKVIPCGLSDLFAMSTFCSQCKHACWACAKKNTDNGESAAAVDLKKCSACHTAEYCGKECQEKDWKERHRRWCKALPEFLKLTKIDYSKYNECSLFGSLPVGRIW